MLDLKLQRQCEYYSYTHYIATNSKQAETATAANILEAEVDLFNSSYIPNNPSLVLDTSLWKSTERSVQGSDERGSNAASPLVHLQPIVVESTQTDETIFLQPAEGKLTSLPARMVQ